MKATQSIDAFYKREAPEPMTALALLRLSRLQGVLPNALREGTKRARGREGEGYRR